MGIYFQVEIWRELFNWMVTCRNSVSVIANGGPNYSSSRVFSVGKTLNLLPTFSHWLLPAGVKMVSHVTGVVNCRKVATHHGTSTYVNGV